MLRVAVVMVLAASWHLGALLPVMTVAAAVAVLSALALSR
jgi:hypothetical protein